MLTLIDGDLFEIDGLDGLAHGVNAEGKMCSGIAVEFRERFPEMHERYIETCRKALMAGGLFAYRDQDNFWIYNCFSQEFAGPNASLEHLRTSLYAMVYDAEHKGLARIGLPWIGTGVGALAREDVLEVFKDILGPSSVEFVVVNFVPESSLEPTPEEKEASVSLDVVEEVLREHVLEWKINERGGGPDEASFSDDVRGWCSCLERVSDYPLHVREEIEKVVNA